MKTSHFLQSYNKHARQLLKKFGRKQAMSLAVGGDFDAVGTIEFCLLVQSGLQEQHTVVEVGCGSGRLAFQLREFLKGQYVGTDVVPELYKYAQGICQRPDWKFITAPGLTIPLSENFADFVCFFSVFTHLLHEESYKYLEEARRVVKPGGKIIFSFLDFAIPGHWGHFEVALRDERTDKVLTQFMSKDAIQAWAEHLSLKVLEFADSDKPHINLDRIIRWEDGRESTGKVSLGQSVCILTK